MTTTVYPEEREPAPIDELSDWTFSFFLVVPDGSGGERAPTLSELTALELTVYNVATDTPITVWVWNAGAGTWEEDVEVLKNKDVKNTGRGVYVEATGKLTIALGAGDNPFVGTGAVGTLEDHIAIVTGRYNTNLSQFHKRVIFSVKNLGKVPRVP